MSGNNMDEDTKDLAWLSKIYAELKHYPNVETTRDEELRAVVMSGLTKSEGYCPCSTGRVPCPCNSIKHVDSGSMSACRCGLFVGKTDNA